MFISDEGLVSGSIVRSELVAAYADATDETVRDNLAAVGAENGMYVEDGELVDPSVPVLEPEPEPETVEEPEPVSESGAPPLGGPGSGREAWVAYAESLGVEVTDDMTRDDIVAAVEEKG